MTNSNTSGLRLLYADDEAPLRELMSLELPELGHQVTVCEDGEKAVRQFEKQLFDAAILDIRMPGLTGIDVLKNIKNMSPETEVVLLTGHATLDTAVESLRLGAFDYLTKPCRIAELKAVLNKIVEKRNLTNHNLALKTRVVNAEGKSQLIGDSPAMKQVNAIVEKVAPTDSTVLILGETGTGKEVAARSIHLMSKRKDGPFVPLNCGALPEHLVESELFGHRKGAFTGADSNRKGLFEVANGGTLFLDEVGELPKSMQAKLLRFLESGEIRRVGENEPFTVDVRVLCATNRDLREMSETEDFREDLYYRINTFEVVLPALRDRGNDIVGLAEYLLTRAAKGKDMTGKIDPSTADRLASFEWKGNVRELANAMEYAFILSGGETVLPEHLPGNLSPAASGSISSKMNDGHLTLHDLEQYYIQYVLDLHDGNKPDAAKKLGISLKTLYNRLNMMSHLDKMAG